MKKENSPIKSSYLVTEKMGAGYGKKLVIDGVDINVGRGETVTLIGPNGSGKSTVLKSIIKQLDLIKGAVFLDGKNMASMRSAQLAKKVSILMTDRVKSELMTCYDIVATARYPYTGSLGLLDDNDRRIISEAIDTVNANDLAGEDFNSISDGQKQRILLARCIAQEPELIVLDEPTSYLDIKYKIELLQILKKLAADKGTAIIMSMHEIDLARQISDRVVCIGRDGIDRIGPPDEVLASEYICRLFDIPKQDYDEFFGRSLGIADGAGIPEPGAGFVSKNGKLMRKGITTGTCAAAATYGAVTKLLTGEVLKTVSLVTPSGEKVEVDITNIANSTFSVKKDSGDDPDVTNGAEICVSAEPVDIMYNKTSSSEMLFADASYPGIYITGGEGVGTVTKEGLEQPVGYPAINRVPRRMIFKAADSVRSISGYDGGILITVSVKDGKELAAKTFNPDLGIEGGISILGTSGILEPMSDKAVIDTIEALIKQQSVLGRKALLMTPGLYGQGYVKKDLGLDLEGSVKVSNYIGEAIDIAVSYDFDHVLLVGNLGKLIKLAAGIMNTHSRVADGRMDIMCTHLALCGGNKEMAVQLYDCINTDSALDKLKEWGLCDEVLKSLISQIDVRIRKRAGEKLRVGVMVFSEKYGYLGETEYAKEALLAYRDESNT
jgi:cobalt-precorrin-5B (C1)-methyltransferase